MKFRKKLVAFLMSMVCLCNLFGFSSYAATPVSDPIIVTANPSTGVVPNDGSRKIQTTGNVNWVSVSLLPVYDEHRKEYTNVTLKFYSEASKKYKTYICAANGQVQKLPFTCDKGICGVEWSGANNDVIHMTFVFGK